MGNNQAALADFNKAIKIDPVDFEAYYYRGISKLNQKHFYEALDDLKKSYDLLEELQGAKTKAIEFQYSLIYDGQALCYLQLGDHDQSLTLLNRAVFMFPDNKKFLLDRSTVFFVQHHYKDSITDLEAALQISPKDPQVLYKLGLSYYRLPNFKRCIKILKKSLKNSPFVSYEADIYYHIGLAYSQLGKYERSIYPFSKAIELIPSDVRYLHERAKSY
mmetsp:Transcript_33519/g.24582  ORF Transcript_33519/g.24582 Transcript_33519/m.24582 type:complete len:218 (-) Transcript_33519:73-726(-)